MGVVEMKTPAEELKKDIEMGIGNIGAPIQTTKLQYADGNAVCCISPIHQSLLCVAHVTTEHIWVYAHDGELKQKVKIPGVDAIWGMVVLDENKGQLAIVDIEQSKIHMVTLSEDLQIQHPPRDVLVPFVPTRLSLNSKRELVVAQWNLKRCAVLTAGGVLLHDIQLQIPGYEIGTTSVAQVTSGYVVVDYWNKKVHFTDVTGGLLHTSSHCKDPRGAVVTSWGHVLVTDYNDRKITVLSESGDLLGHVQDNNGTRPQYIHIDEAERLLYVDCGPTGKSEVRTYRFSPSDLPVLPVSRTVRRLEMSVRLATL
jgi:hypothetical protein